MKQRNRFAGCAGFPLFGLVLLLGLPLLVEAGYWRVSGPPEVTFREVSDDHNGHEFRLVSCGGDFVQFAYRDGISGNRIRLYVKWTTPGAIVPGEVVPVTLAYEVAGPHMGRASARFDLPAGVTDAGVDLLSFILAPESPPAQRLINARAKAPLASGNRVMYFEAGLTGGLRYGVRIPYAWMEGALPKDAQTGAPPETQAGSGSGAQAGAPGGKLPGATGGTQAGGKDTGAGTPAKGKPAETAGVRLLYNGNVDSVYNGGTNFRFRLTGPYVITLIQSYHWNNGQGTPVPGTIWLQDEKGRVFGPWEATGSQGQGGVPNAYWNVRPNLRLEAGAYTVVDSDPATWSQNSGTAGQGIVLIEGSKALQPE